MLGLGFGGIGAGDRWKCGGEEAAASPEAKVVTWYGDIQPLVQRVCLACHDGSGVGGIAFTDAATVQTLAGVMAAQVGAGNMPPPSMDPACHGYAGADRMNLSAGERALFAAWADGGAVLGDPVESPPRGNGGAGSSLEEPYTTLEMSTPYQVAPDSDGNEYLCTVVDNPFTETVWISALEAVPGNPKVVHHMMLVRDIGKDAGASYGVPPGTRVFQCSNPIVELDWQVLHAFAPGVGVTQLPEGTGIRVEPGDQIVLQNHYYAPPGVNALDRSGYRLRISHDAPRVEVFMDGFGPAHFTIPAGEPAHPERRVQVNEGPPVTVYGVFPHMHLLGKSYHAWIEGDDTESACTASGNYSFHHQALYLYDQPLIWGTGQRFVTECVWDNSAETPGRPNYPPKDVTWGEYTNQEMCYMVGYLSTGSPAPKGP